MRPLVVSLVLDPAAQERFDAVRREHFPPERLVVGAHVSLFHALPGEHEPQVRADLEQAARRAAFAVTVSAVRSLGRGVAYGLRSEELALLHRRLQQRWEPWLTPQDRQRLSAHVTVQNKVPPEDARRLHAALSAGFVPYEVHAQGLALWRYAGGPWEPLATYPFSRAADDGPRSRGPRGGTS